MFSFRTSYGKNENQKRFLGVNIFPKISHHQHTATLCFIKTYKLWVGLVVLKGGESSGQFRWFTIAKIEL